MAATARGFDLSLHLDTGSATVTFVVTFRAARCTIKDQRFFFLAIKQFALLFVRLVRLFAIWA
ncbi:Uncharacterised protein [Vibrio cholerae]|nr:Uncharacterised protein [Vibrio cholerae]